MTALFWLAILIGFLVMEANTVSLVSLWFSAGALVALIANLLQAEIWLQIVLFLSVSALLLACLRPLLRKYYKPKLVKTNVDALVGTQGYVTADIDNLSATGSVKLGAMDWTARSSSGAPIAKGTLVKVEKVEGVKAFVSPVEVEVKL